MDAALVALAWQSLVSRSFGNAIRPSIAAALFFAVWSIYLGDRLWDSRYEETSSPRTQRHRLAREHRRIFAFLAMGSFLLAAFFGISSLSSISPFTGVILSVVGALCAGYYLARAGFPEWERGRAIVVGGVFAAGTLVAVPGPGGIFFCWLVFSLGALFTANVRICVWSEARAAELSPALSLFRPLVLSALGFTVTAIAGHWQIALAGLLSIASLWVLFLKRERLAPETLAIQADALLFAPPLLITALAFCFG